MNKALAFKVMGLASFKNMKAIREVEVFFSTPYEDFEREDPCTLVIFSLKGPRKDILKVIYDLGNFFAYVFTLADIPVEKFPQSLRIDDDNHTVELSRNGEWTEEDYLNLCILMEAVSSIFGWNFRYNEYRPTIVSPLFSESLRS